jgi:gliding motility-associatede transport system auxiliary component
MAEVLANQVLYVDAVRWLIGEESFAGPPNTEEDKKIKHTKQEDLAWFYSSIFGAPALVLGLGVWVSRRSRAKGGRR